MLNKDSLYFIQDSLQSNSNLIIEDIQNYINTGEVQSKKTIVFLSLASNYLQSNNLSNFIQIISPFIENENNQVVLSQLLSDNLVFIKQINNNISNNKFRTKKLIDINWKLVGRATLEQAELGSFEPKIILQLKYSDDSFDTVETDFGTFKKLQEELEISCNSYNSSYSRKINAFSK